MNPSAREPGPQVAVIVAHPDDETLWAGGTLLCHPDWDLVIVALNHRTDPDRAPRFKRALQAYRAAGDLGDLRDGGREDVLPEGEVEAAILRLLPRHDFDLILTHSSTGEYTEHLVHDEVSDAVKVLIDQGRLRTRELWHFAYQDDGGQAKVHAQASATVKVPLPEHLWREKLNLVTGVYGKGPDAWEVLNCPREEGFRLILPKEGLAEGTSLLAPSCGMPASGLAEE